MKTFLQCCATGLLALVATQGYSQESQGLPAVDTEVPSEQGSQITDDASGIFPEDESPWFSAEGLQEELELDDDQVRRLNDAYGATWRQMRAGGGGVGAAGAAGGAGSDGALDEQARTRRTNEYRDRFDGEFNRSTSSVFRNPQQRQRFNQLQMQSQGFGAFDNPRLQRQLNLNDTQNRQLQELRRDFDGQVEGLREGFASNPDDARTRFNDLRGSSRQRFDGILNEQQRQSFGEMTGEPFDFSPDSFLGGRDAGQGGVNREASPGFNTGQSPGFNSGLNPNPADNNNTGNNNADAGTGGTEAGTGTGGTPGTGTGTGGTGGTGSGAGGTGSGAGGTGSGAGGTGSGGTGGSGTGSGSGS